MTRTVPNLLRGLLSISPLFVAAAVTAQTTQPSGGGSPVITQVFQGHTYELFIDNTSSWTQAQSAASRAGGYLSAITSAGEDQFIDQLLTSGHAATGSYWIGLENNQTTTGGIPGVPGQGGNLTGWTWSDNEPFSYSNWTPGVPDNFMGQENRGSILWTADSTASTFSRRGQWNDLPDSGYPNANLNGAGTDLQRGGYIVEINSVSGSTGKGGGGTSVPVPAAALLFLPGAAVALAAARRMRSWA